MDLFTLIEKLLLDKDQFIFILVEKILLTGLKMHVLYILAFFICKIICWPSCCLHTVAFATFCHFNSLSGCCCMSKCYVSYTFF
jgi:hypothetical protein